MIDGADRTLHIGVDARELVGHVTGVGRYLSEVLKAWASEPFPHRVTLFVPAETPDYGSALGPMFATHVIAADSAGTTWEQTRLPGAARRAGIDVLFAPAYTAPLLLRRPVVPLIHDVSYCAHPEWFSGRDGLRRRWLTWATARRAASILTVSEFSRSEIVKYLGVPENRMTIASPGAPRVVRPVPAVAREPIVLSVGSLFNRRRIPELIAGFAALAPRVPDATLVIVGDNRTAPPVDPRAIARQLGVEARVSWREYVGDDELESLYWRARAFAFFSDYEGFAMTPLEALAHDVPAVMADTAVAREIYGDAATRVPLDPRAIADALAPLLTDQGAHETAVARGRARLNRFSWSRTAGIVRQALERAAQTTRTRT